MKRSRAPAAVYNAQDPKPPKVPKVKATQVNVQTPPPLDSFLTRPFVPAPSTAVYNAPEPKVRATKNKVQPQTTITTTCDLAEL